MSGVLCFKCGQKGHFANLCVAFLFCPCIDASALTLCCTRFVPEGAQTVTFPATAVDSTGPACRSPSRPVLPASESAARHPASLRPVSNLLSSLWPAWKRRRQRSTNSAA